MQEISSFGLIYKYDLTQWLYFTLMTKFTYCRHQIKATDCQCSISLREKKIFRNRDLKTSDICLIIKIITFCYHIFKDAKFHQPPFVAIVPKEWSARTTENNFSGLVKRSSFFEGVHWPNNLIDEIDFKNVFFS